MSEFLNYPVVPTPLDGTEYFPISQRGKKFRILASDVMGGGSTTETDPVFTASAAFGISAGDITNWNAAYGWGNHIGLYAALAHNHSATEITSGILAQTRGGTGIGSYLQGDFIYAGAGGTLVQRTIGPNGTILTSNGTVPVWTSPAAPVIDQAADYAWTGKHRYLATVGITQVENKGLWLEANTPATFANPQYSPAQYFVAKAFQTASVSRDLRFRLFATSVGGTSLSGSLLFQYANDISTPYVTIATINSAGSFIPGAGGFTTSNGSQIISISNGMRSITAGVFEFQTNNGTVASFGSDAFGGGTRFPISSVVIGSTTQVASSQLTLVSTTKGFLPPRMTTSQRTSIASPAAGLMVYDTTINKLYLFTTAWQQITSS